MNILGIGIARLDVINEVAEYPPKDTEVRTIGQRLVGGGNVTNTLSRATGSRTIVYHRDLPELAASQFRGHGVEQLDWVHLEGRNPEQTRQLIATIRRRRPGLSVSVEIEKPRTGIEMLFSDADLLLLSRAFARARGFHEPEHFLNDYQLPAGTRCVLGWGTDGAYAKDRDGTLIHSADCPKRILDTVGAGDVLNGAVIHGLLHRDSLEAVLTRAARLAGFKCGQFGFASLIEGARSRRLI